MIPALRALLPRTKENSLTCASPAETIHLIYWLVFGRIRERTSTAKTNFENIIIVFFFELLLCCYCFLEYSLNKGSIIDQIVQSVEDTLHQIQYWTRGLLNMLSVLMSKEAKGTQQSKKYQLIYYNKTSDN